MDVQQEQVRRGRPKYVPSADLLDARAAAARPGPDRAAADIIAGEREGRDHRGARRPAVRARARRFSGLQERTGALLATTLQAKNWLCGPHRVTTSGSPGCYGSKAAMELLQEADCVIAVGASLNSYTIEHGYLYPDARYVQIDTRRAVVMGNGAGGGLLHPGRRGHRARRAEPGAGASGRSRSRASTPTQVRERLGEPLRGPGRVRERAGPDRPARGHQGPRRRAPRRDRAGAGQRPPGGLRHHALPAVARGAVELRHVRRHRPGTAADHRGDRRRRRPARLRGRGRRQLPHAPVRSSRRPAGTGCRSWSSS